MYKSIRVLTRISTASGLNVIFIDLFFCGTNSSKLYLSASVNPSTSLKNHGHSLDIKFKSLPNFSKYPNLVSRVLEYPLLNLPDPILFFRNCQAVFISLLVAPLDSLMRPPNNPYDVLKLNNTL